ncbi:MAG: signal peptidase II [Actinomycetota bacterium]|nr:signal peptidase II [Actinomycetota bacterium]
MKAEQKKLKGNLLAFVIFVSVLGIDQLSKFLIVKHISPGEGISLIGDFVKLRNVSNTGIAFGLFQDNSSLVALSVLVAIAMIASGFYMFRKEKDTLLMISLGLMGGGALGNLLDRIVRGGVIDFIDFGWWPVFNIADIAIVACVLILVVDIVRKFRSEWTSKKEGD